MQMNEVILRIKSFDWKKHEARIKEIVQKKPIFVGLAVVGDRDSLRSLQL